MVLLALSGCMAAASGGAPAVPCPSASGPSVGLAVPAVADKPLSVRHTLRRVPITLGIEDAKIAIVTSGFYCKLWNAGGRGLAHAYTTKVVGGVLVVTDEATGLMWQRAGQSRYVDGGREGAELYVQQLNGQAFAGFRDWRLPTLDEAMSLMTDDAHAHPYDLVADGQGGSEQKIAAAWHLDLVFDTNSSPFIWTADFRSADASGDPDGGHDPRVRRGWQVDFLYGQALTRDLSSDAFVRAVRSM
jgi:Protein of unknown function (DUF1566)